MNSGPSAWRCDRRLRRESSTRPQPCKANPEGVCLSGTSRGTEGGKIASLDYRVLSQSRRSLRPFLFVENTRTGYFVFSFVCFSKSAMSTTITEQ